MEVMTSLGQVGVIENISDGKTRIRVGAISLTQSIDQLRPVKTTGKSATKKSSATARPLESVASGSDSIGATVELNLIGMKADEAEYELDRFLDDAIYNGDSRVRIIHGHGTGRLRKMVHEFLKNSPLVDKFGFADPDKGGSGATVAELSS
jgi:DNA mismatch repair protein MutS2